MGKLTKARMEILDCAANRASIAKGTYTLFDGRKWPAINALRAAGLIVVESVRLSHHDTIELRITPAGRAALSKETDQ